VADTDDVARSTVMVTALEEMRMLSPSAQVMSEPPHESEPTTQSAVSYEDT